MVVRSRSSLGAPMSRPLYFGVAILVLSAFGCRTPDPAANAKRIVAPAYPPISIAAAVEGDVIVHVTIDDSGSVRAAAVTRGHPLLNRAALDAAQRWSFNAARGSRQADVTFSFRINRSSATSESSAFVPPYRVEIVGVPEPPSVNYDHAQGKRRPY